MKHYTTIWHVSSGCSFTLMYVMLQMSAGESTDYLKHAVSSSHHYPVRIGIALLVDYATWYSYSVPQMRSTKCVTEALPPPWPPDPGFDQGLLADSLITKIIRKTILYFLHPVRFTAIPHISIQVFEVPTIFQLLMRQVIQFNSSYMAA